MLIQLLKLLGISLLNHPVYIYHLVRENSTGSYILHNNRNLEVYHVYICKEDHVTAVCTAANNYGAAQTVFHLWNHEKFYQGVLNTFYAQQLGNITSKVHYDGDNTAKALIDLVKVNMQSRNPPSVHLPSGWMMCLSPYCNWDCDDDSSIISGGGSELLTFKQELVLYVKNLANYQNYIRYYSY